MSVSHIFPVRPLLVPANVQLGLLLTPLRLCTLSWSISSSGTLANLVRFSTCVSTIPFRSVRYCHHTHRTMTDALVLSTRSYSSF